MHMWGDDWFENNGQDLYAAINYIETYLRKHHIGVCGKEKYGTYRDEYLTFWNGGLYQILFGYRAYTGTFNTYKFKINKDRKDDENYWKNRFNKKISPKIVNFVDKIHKFIYNKIDYAMPTIPDGTPLEKYHEYYDKRIWKGLINFNKKIGLTLLIQGAQARVYNHAFQNACKRWPHIQEELIVMVDGWKMIKPCRWGDIDGEKIHNKYWKPVDTTKNKETENETE